MEIHNQAEKNKEIKFLYIFYFLQKFIISTSKIRIYNEISTMDKCKRSSPSP